MPIRDAKKTWTPIALATAACLVISGAVSFADSGVTLSGIVKDSAGKPVKHATVMVYHAGVKTGYSTFCPSCYPDCGKRAITDAHGTFKIKGLRPDLWFELLMAGEGYEPTFVNKVIPSAGAPVTATLGRRQRVSDPSRLFRGRVEDSRGVPLRDAVVQPIGALLNAKTGTSMYGTIEGMDPIAISTKKGDFEIAYLEPTAKLAAEVNAGRMPPAFAHAPIRILVSVDARGLAPAFAEIPAGVQLQTITVAEGATVRGRLVEGGKPVGGVEVGLVGRPRGGYGANLKPIGYPYDEMRIGTQPDGTFAVTSIPAPADWNVYGKMESLATRGATGAIECATKHDGEIVDVGDIQVKSAYHLRGKVVLSDGRPIPEGMRVTVSSKHSGDSQTGVLSPDGSFEFLGLAAGDYTVFASVKGYALPDVPVSFKGKDGKVTTHHTPAFTAPLSIDRDVNDFVIKLYPHQS
jgi:hypothetical protein